MDKRYPINRRSFLKTMTAGIITAGTPASLLAEIISVKSYNKSNIYENHIKDYLHKIAKQENINADDDALHIIAQKADGALRDALSIFDRVVSFSGNNLTHLAVTENLNVLDYEVFLDLQN